MDSRFVVITGLVLIAISAITRAKSFSVSADPRGSEHPEEESGFFEGDIKLDNKTRKDILESGRENWVRDAINGNSYRWPNGTVHYTLHKLPPRTSRVIKQAMRHITKFTNGCIKFKPRRNNQRDYVRFFKGGGCYSYIGRIGGKQDISIGAGCEYKLGISIHEILHALGFYHEQSRQDRDKFVTVNFNNIRSSAQNNFQEYTAGAASTLGFQYDYDSVMHYSKFAFSKNGKATIEPKQAGAKIGQREKLSQIDIKQVMKLYGCSK